MAFLDRVVLTAWSRDGKEKAEISGLVANLTWSGSYTDCARRLTYSMLPQGLSQLGGRVRMTMGTEVLFDGFVFARRRGTLDKTISVTAFDRGIYLKRNQTYRKVRRQTAEGVTGQLCRDYGIPCGTLAATGVPLDRNFMGSSLYQVIQTMYTLAAEQTGKRYQLRFRGERLEVVEKARSWETIRLIPGSNLISCDSEDSIENLVTSVAVYDDEARQLAVYDSPEGLRGLYGLMQQAIKAGKKDDPAKTARQTLGDNGPKTTITARCQGSIKLKTGNTVVVHEPVTGTDGLFWVQSDSHSWSKGLYQTTVMLEFRNLMDRQTAGSVPTK